VTWDVTAIGTGDLSDTETPIAGIARYGDEWLGVAGSLEAQPSLVASADMKHWCLLADAPITGFDSLVIHGNRLVLAGQSGGIVSTDLSASTDFVCRDALSGPIPVITGGGGGGGTGSGGGVCDVFSLIGLLGFVTLRRRFRGRG
jgi:hypothetical protein